MARIPFGRNLTILFLTFIQGVLWSQTEEIRISARFFDVPTISVLEQLEQRYPVRFFFKEEWLKNDTLRVTLNNNTIQEAIEILFRDKPFTSKIIDKNVVIIPRADLAMLLGQIPNFSNGNGSDDKFTVIGSLSEAGKYKKASLTGQIIDGKTGEAVIGATIQPQNLPQGAVTNIQGNYKLMLTPGLYTLIVSSVGYEQALLNVKIISNGELTIELFDKSVTFDDIVIYGKRLDRNVSSHQMSLIEMNINEIGQLPSVSGGKDVLKGLTVMPGIKSSGEFIAPLFSNAHILRFRSALAAGVGCL
jgi:hypothetical protein